MATRSEFHEAYFQSIDDGNTERAQRIADKLGYVPKRDPEAVDTSLPPPDFDVNRAIIESQAIEPGMEALGEAGRYARDVVTNIPSSLMDVASGFASAVMNPLETGEALGRTVMGAGEMAGVLPGEENVPYAQAMVDYYKDRYGGGENILETIRTDPAGALLDVAPAGALVGKATAISPISGAAKAVTPRLQRAADAVRRKEFTSDVKFSTKLTDRDRDKLVDTAMEYNLSPNRGGLGRLRAKAEALEADVDSMVDVITESRPVSRLLEGLDETRGKARTNLISGTDDLKTIQKVEDRIIDNVQRLRGTASPYDEPLTAAQLQKFKRDAYRKIDWNKKKRLTRNEAEKDVAFAAKEALEELSPGLKATNREWGRLIDLEKPLMEAINRIENRHANWWQWQGNLGAMLTGAGRGTARAATKAAPRLTEMLDNPAVAALTQAGWLADIQEESETDIPYLYPR